MSKAKHSHERHPGGRGRKNPKTPKGERDLHYGASDRSERANRAELREIGGSGFPVGQGGYGPGGMLSCVQFEGTGDVTSTAPAGMGDGAATASGAP